MQTASFFTYGGPGRVSIARSAPRKHPPGYKTFRALAPGKWFNSVTKEEYVELFRREVLGPLEPKATYQRLIELADGAEPVLLCWERPPFTDTNWCHRRMVAEWFEERLGISVPEFKLTATVEAVC